MPRDLLSGESDHSTDELFTAVLSDLRDEADARLGPLVALHGRPTRLVVDRCLALCDSVDAYERTVGLQILRELHHPHLDRQAMWLPIEPIVIALATNDEDPTVVAWAISCLGYQPAGPEALAAVLTQVNHNDSKVRYAVAQTLPALLDPENLDRDGLAALSKLTDDPDADVRAYAIMGLTRDLGLVDRIRPILEAHLSDSDEHIRNHVRGVLNGTDS